MAAAKHLPGFGQELVDLQYEDFWDWFVKVNDPVTMWRAQPTYVLSQLSYILGGLITLVHALRNGGRLPYVWLAAALHGLVVEAMSYNLEDVDNFWHAQALVIFLGRRLPLHIILLYPVFIYNAVVAVSHMNLHRWAEPFAAGLLVILIDIPYDIVSVKFIHWSWHDTDPNIADRHYWVPWNSYYFHATFAASFCFWITAWRDARWKAGSFLQEIKNCTLAALLGTPGGVLLFLPLYHPLHDIAKIHSEVTFFIIFTVFLAIIWTSERSPKPQMQGTDCRWNKLILAHLVAHYSLFLGIVLFGHPENEISTGFHERVGPCDETVPVQTAFGLVLQKKRYLCASNYDEAYFDFHCLPGGKLPANGVSWYTICGNHFTNRTEYIAIIMTICFLAATVFWNIYIRSTSFKRSGNHNLKSKQKSH
ncbi:uncharacterized protein LOC126259609 [Schistocerca nitens]|uniref:uncharacterized protein LOC126259609 n=1 Tax=Schistocerca nitens TaxID=7011 RepID=UPI002118EF5E|nr:uncharacterized protein LOC126259609 [Schistocerca nitens]